MRGSFVNREFKMEKIRNPEVLIGFIMGLAGGVLGNIFVTAMYRFMDGVAKGYNGWTMLLSGLGSLGAMSLALHIAMKQMQNKP